jgi:hyperosmotically inducible protein
MKRDPRFSRAVWVVLVTAVALAGCASNRTVGEQVDDVAITAAVKTKLAADPEVNPFEIDVDTTDGVVRLSGTVDEAGDRAEAERLARDTGGVRRVINAIKVGPGPTAGQELDCARIVTEVNARLAADPEVSSFQVDVDCEGSVVTLSGNVADAEARAAAERLAAGTTGVSRVVNRLTVGGS